MWWLLPQELAAIDPWLQAVGVVAAALVAATGGILIARRASSGSTATSDAATLWQAAETIRLEQRGRIESQDDEIGKLKERVAVLESQNRDQGRRLEDQAIQIHDQAIQIHDLEAELARLRGVVGE